jgi:hypothetical protein
MQNLSVKSMVMIFVKVVDLLTKKPTKLVLHFSDLSLIFYEFCKMLDLTQKELRIF